MGALHPEPDEAQDPLRMLRARVPWLLIGLAGGLAAGGVASLFEASLEREVTIAFFLPLVFYMADAIGTRTETVLVRRLAYGRVALAGQLAREGALGLLLGASLGGAAALALWLFGGRAGADAALASEPVATVVQDVVSVAIYFAIASACSSGHAAGAGRPPRGLGTGNASPRAPPSNGQEDPMTARKQSSRKKASRKPSASRQLASTRAAASARVRSLLARVEAELPPTIRQATGRMSVQLRRLERELDRAQARYRAQLARLLRDAGAELERLEAEGERTWTRVDARARVRILDLLRRLEKAVAQPSRPGPKRAARKAVRRAKRTLRGAASAVAP